MEWYLKYDFFDIQQAFFIWYRPDKGFYWDDKATPGVAPFYIEPDGSFMIITNELERKAIEAKIKRKGLCPPFLIESPETESYYPLRVLEEEPTLFLKFSEVIPTREGILEFANKYGRLTTLGETQVLNTDKSKFPIKKGDHIIIERLLVFGESLEFWQNEIQDMAWAVTIWEAVKERDEEFLKRVIFWDEEEGIRYILVNIPKEILFEFKNAKEVEETVNNNPDYLESYLPPEVPLITSSGIIEPELEDNEIFSRFKPGNLFLPAQYLIKTTINEKLRYYKAIPHLIVDKENMLKPYIMPESLLSAMWYQFYLTVIGEKKIKRCLICGRWEDITDKTAAWTKHESCANKERVGRYRQAIKEAQKLYQEGKTIEEIAEKLGKPIEWVRKQVSKTKNSIVRDKG